LPNTVLMEKQLGGLIEQAEAAGHRVNVWIVQLDSLKHINTAFGYDTGDAIIRLAAERLKPLAEGGVLARFWGDRFLIALQSADHGRYIATELAKRILSQMDAPVIHDGFEYTVNASIGIARYPGDGVSVEKLIGKAGIALEIAERKGRCYQFCRQEDAQKARERRLMLLDLRHALKKAGFTSYISPL
jgi:diguanylate cyclase (GGDEF)-like protein